MNKTKIQPLRLFSMEAHECEQISRSYIAGFFDGEGSAMILTIKRKREHVFRFRAVIKIAQKSLLMLETLKEMLGYGTVVKNRGTPCLQINGSKKILRFIAEIAPYVILKKRQLALLGELVKLQYRKNTSYSREEVTQMLRLRDDVHALNALNHDNAKIPLKHSTEVILS